MKEYNKEKLHEYAKELFALCLEKGFSLDLMDSKYIRVEYNKNRHFLTYINEEHFNDGIHDFCMPIWELIEKVKQL